MSTTKRKGKPETERVKNLKKNFLRIRREHPEKSIKEIAKEYKVDLRYTYTLIEQIAEKEGISKEELLFVPHKKHSLRNSKKKAVSVNVENMIEQIDAAIKLTESIIVKIENMELGIQEEEL